MLEFCPAALLVVDEDGRLLFHNARLREMLGYQQGRARSHATPACSGTTSSSARGSSSRLRERGGQLLNEKVVWRTKNGQLASSAAVLRAGRLPGRACQLRRRQARAVGLRHHRADPARDAGRRAGAPASRNPRLLSGGGVRRRRGRAAPVPQSADARPARLREGRTGSLRHQAVLARPRSSNAHHRTAASRAAASC